VRDKDAGKGRFEERIVTAAKKKGGQTVFIVRGGGKDTVF